MKALPQESTSMWMSTSERNGLSKPAKIMIPIFQTKPPRYSKLPAMQFKSKQPQKSLANTTLSSKTKVELQPLQFKSTKISTNSSKITKNPTMRCSTTKWRTLQRSQCPSEDCLQPRWVAGPNRGALKLPSLRKCMMKTTSHRWTTQTLVQAKRHRTCASFTSKTRARHIVPSKIS